MPRFTARTVGRWSGVVSFSVVWRNVHGWGCVCSGIKVVALSPDEKLCRLILIEDGDKRFAY